MHRLVQRAAVSCPFRVAAVTLLACTASSWGVTPTLVDLGVPTGATGAQGVGINADGTIACGSAIFPSGYRIFRWTKLGGLTDLGVVSGDDASVAGAISADGNTVVGTGVAGATQRAVAWTSGTGLVALSAIGPGAATGVSSTGSVIAGWGTLAGGQRRAVRWNAGTPTDLGVLSGGLNSLALGVSADGATIVGATTGTAFVWTSANAMVAIPRLAGWGGEIAARACSADGSIVVGSADTPGGTRAFRWTGAGLPAELTGPGAGTAAWAQGVSGDGALIAGQIQRAPGDLAAFTWTAGTGMLDLNLSLPAQGVNVKGWYQFTSARGVSADGTAIIGTGIKSNGQTRAFLVTGYGVTGDDPKPCSKADLTDASGYGPPDGQLSASDVVLFFQSFFAGCVVDSAPCGPADVSDSFSGFGLPDGQMSAQDVVSFFTAFFTGCS